MEVFMKYLIDETTKEERLELVYKALGISTSDAKEPSEETMKIVNEYIEGITELNEVQKRVINLYKKKKEVD